jgi:hypothetical protein
MSDPWTATVQAACRIERAAESSNLGLLRDEMGGIVARFGHRPNDDSPERVVLALARACIAAIDAAEDAEEDEAA